MIVNNYVKIGKPVDPSSGNTYYFNNVSREVTWECPTPTLEDNFYNVVSNQECTENAMQRQGEVFCKPTYDRILKLKQVKKKDRVGLYGKSYLREHFGLNWHAPNENICIVNSWFDPSIEQARKFLHSSLKNNPNLVAEVKQYIEQKLAIRPALLHPYIFRDTQTTTSMTWGVIEIYERFKQLKGDYLKKLRRKVSVNQLEGNLGNDMQEIATEDLQTVDQQRTLQDLRCGELQTNRHIEEMDEVQDCQVEQHQGGLTEGDEYREDEIVVHRMEEANDRMGTAEVSVDALEDISNLQIRVSHGMRDGHVDGEGRKQRKKRPSMECEGNSRPGRMRPRQRSECMILAGIDEDTMHNLEEQDYVDTSRLSEISKKIIGKHVMGCGVLSDVMKEISDFASQLPDYNKLEFSKLKVKERKMVQLDFVVKWALRSRVTLKDVDLIGTNEIIVDSSMVVDRL